MFSGDRWCLAGEAGVFLDPLYSPGLDLIAISNGLITDLVGRALDGEDVEELAAIHNKMFSDHREGWLTIYENQYPLMGNARVMTRQGHLGHRRLLGRPRAALLPRQVADAGRPPAVLVEPGPVQRRQQGSPAVLP